MKPVSGLAVLLVVNACGVAQTARNQMSPDQILQQYAITAKVGHKDIAPGKGSAAGAVAAVDQSNEEGRLAGFPDSLNPVNIDKEKVRAFLSFLPGLPPATLERLRGRTLFLNDPNLKLQSYMPTTAASIAQGYTLSVDDQDSGPIAKVSLDAPIDLKLARDRADLARRTMEDADREAASLEKRKQRPDSDSATFVAQSTAERKRYAAATVWRDLASMLADRNRNDRTLQLEAAEAKREAARFVVAPWTGMPQ